MMPKQFKIDYIHFFFLIVGVVSGYFLGSYFPIRNYFDLSTNRTNISLSEVLGKSDKEAEKVGVKEEVESCDLTVEVAGAVNRPGVYCFTQGSLVNEALTKSDGLNRLAAIRYVSQRINLAEKLTGNQKIYFPYEDDLKCELVPFISDSKLDSYLGGSSTSKGCISINGGTQKDLETLKGIGAVTAGKIVDGRPYSKVEDLKSRAVLTEKLYDQVKEGICL